MNKIQKEAAKDAHRWAQAEMFFGEGAGTRRRHLDAEISSKFADEDYANMFYQVYDALDWTKITESALKERKAIDRAAKAGKNLRAIKSGNLRGLSTGVYVVVIGAYVAHQTGYDKVIEAKAKDLYKKAKAEVKFRKARAQGRNVEKIN